MTPVILAAALLTLQAALSVPQAQGLVPPALARVEAVPITQPVAPGARVRLRVKVVPREGLKIYAPGERTYKPVALTVNGSTGVTAEKPAYPRATSATFEGAPVRVYSGPFEIVQPVRVAGPAGRAVRITGTLEYQACDEVMCYRPVKVPLGWDLSVR